MINNTFDLDGWWIICISPGIRNLITYIERSEWIDTQYIIDRRRPFAQCRRHIEKNFRQTILSQHIEKNHVTLKKRQDFVSALKREGR